ncbi:hypothetical protein PR048_031877 [Dryococelus australis]|uniref:Uncharacterized protein n=1 Tax=Dryococelus australis TaxID=614101 RepID=A0ABQ9G746_9NEOP|nr:hypothetical protein PR048_031877 [Dryococelus australis]
MRYPLHHDDSETALVNALDSQLVPLNNIDHSFNETAMVAGKYYFYDFMNRRQDLGLLNTPVCSGQQVFIGSNTTLYFDDFGNIFFVHREFFVAMRLVFLVSTRMSLKLPQKRDRNRWHFRISVHSTIIVFPQTRVDNDLTQNPLVGNIFDAHPRFFKWKKSFVEKVNLCGENHDGHATHKDMNVILYALKMTSSCLTCRLIRHTNYISSTELL